MYRKEDRERAHRIAGGVLVLTDHAARKQDIQSLIALLNELGQVAGRIESVLKLHRGAQETERRCLDNVLSGYNSERVIEYADVLTKIARLQSDFDQWPQWRNGIEKRLEAIEVVGDAARLESEKWRDTTESLLVAMKTQFDAVQSRVGELTGLVEAEVSEASAFRKEMRAAVALLGRVPREVERPKGPPKIPVRRWEGKGKRK